ncbi:MAG: class I SAM-dependent methyltransferase [Caldilineaceae bacterium]|nr:class I SAM-dependent methyltransferase [Caldilineaceae bacterium]
MSETTATTKPVSGLSLPPTPSGDYQLLDSGNMRKLEQLGPYLIVRPAPQAIWSPRLPQSAWQRADAVYERDASGGGSWQFRGSVKREFDILFDRLSLRIKLTDFGHLGLFPEQAHNWEWLRNLIRRRLQRTNNRNLHVLNLFGYTGGSTLAASQAGAHVVHVDAAKGVVDWARRNTEISRLQERPIRWLVDDALKFVKREARRNNRYQGIILDPPSFGRGPKGEVFKIEDDLLPLLEECRTLLADDALFILYSGHTPGFTPLVMYNQLATITPKQGQIEHGEMVVVDQQGRMLPSGTYARWFRPEAPSEKATEKSVEKSAAPAK